jgi:DNA replication factor GINS
MTDKYEQLQQAWQREINNKELQDIPDRFLTEMKEYLSVLNDEKMDEDSITDRIINMERSRANQMLKDLNSERLRKIVISELDGTPITATHLTPDEQHLHANLRQLISDFTQGNQITTEHDEKITQIKTKPRPQPSQIRRESDLIVLRFLKPLPAIMGIDLKAYGPFKPEDVASIPRENALNLIRRGLAKEVDIEP